MVNSNRFSNTSNGPIVLRTNTMSSNGAEYMIVERGRSDSFGDLNMSKPILGQSSIIEAGDSKDFIQEEFTSPTKLPKDRNSIRTFTSPEFEQNRPELKLVIEQTSNEAISENKVESSRKSHINSSTSKSDKSLSRSNRVSSKKDEDQ